MDTATNQNARPETDASQRQAPTQTIEPKPLGWLFYAVIFSVLTVFVVVFYYAYQDQRAIVDKSKGIDTASEKDAQDYISGLLLDPSSAQFREVKSYGGCVTGQVNGKNLYGAYTGFTDFFYNKRAREGSVAPASEATSGYDTVDKLQQTLEKAEFSDQVANCIEAK